MSPILGESNKQQIYANFEGISVQYVVWERNIVTLLGGSSHLVSS